MGHVLTADEFRRLAVRRTAATMDALYSTTEYGRQSRGGQCSSQVTDFSIYDGTIEFRTTSTNSSTGLPQDQLIEILDYSQLTQMYPDVFDDIENVGASFDDMKRMVPELVASDVAVYCTCPDFLYSGAAYANTQQGTGIFDETDPPQDDYGPPPGDPRRKPDKDYRKKGNAMLCKHLVSIYFAFFRTR